MDGRPEPKVSIYMLIFAEFEWQWLRTKECIDSVVKYTTSPYELILINQFNRSVLTRLFEFKDQNPVLDIRICHFDESIGVTKGRNTALRMAKGEYIIGMDNDILIQEPDWETKLIKWAEDKTVGLVCPMSNYTCIGPQQCATYEKFRETKKDETVAVVNDLPSLCWCFRREIIQTVGYMDENYVQFGWGDFDWSRAIRVKGYKNLIAKNVFVFHYGRTTTFKNSTEKASKDTYVRNGKYFIQKWNAKEYIPTIANWENIITNDCVKKEPKVGEADGQKS